MSTEEEQVLRALTLRVYSANEEEKQNALLLLPGQVNVVLANLDALRARIRTLEEMLRRLEWVSDGPMVKYCPICEREKHLAMCELKAALDGALGQANGHDDAAKAAELGQLRETEKDYRDLMGEYAEVVRENIALRASTPSTVYHWTDRKSADEILKSGLRQGSFVCRLASDWRGDVCLAIQLPETTNWGERDEAHKWQGITPEWVPPSKIREMPLLGETP